MLIIKLFGKEIGGKGCANETVLSAARYHIINNSDGGIVWIYPTIKGENPICVNLKYEPADDNDYYQMFVMNDQGKTVDRYCAHSPLIGGDGAVKVLQGV